MCLRAPSIVFLSLLGGLMGCESQLSEAPVNSSRSAAVSCDNDPTQSNCSDEVKAPTEEPKKKLDLTAVTSRTFREGTALVAGQTTATIDIDEKATSSDKGMSYTCRFDQVIDGKVESGTPCKQLPGEASFSDVLATLAWTPSSTTDGSFEIVVTGQKQTQSGKTVFVLQVIPPYVRTNLLAEFDARYANVDRAAVAGQSVWYDLNSYKTSAQTIVGTWNGSGIHSAPYRLTLDGVDDYVALGTQLDSQSIYTATGWFRPHSVATSGAMILNATGSSEAAGVAVQQGTTSGTLIMTAGSYATHTVSAQSPLAYWRFGDSSGAATDETGTYNGTYTSVTLSEAGAIAGSDNKAIDVTGGQVDMNVGTAALQAVSLWFKPSSTFNTASGGARLFKEQKASTERLIISLGGATGLCTNEVIAIQHVTSGGTNTRTCVPSITIAANTWHHLGVRWDSGTSRYKVYLNGVEQTTNSGSVSHVSLYTLSEGIAVGDTFSGHMDELALFSSALTEAQIQAHHTAGVGCQVASALVDNQWHHLGLAATGSVVSLYLNGQQKCSLATTSTALSSASGLVVGARSASQNFWAGDFKSLRLYTGATPAVIKLNYDATANRLRETTLAAPPSSGLGLHYDAANGINGVAASADDSCSASIPWFDFSSNARNGTLTSFASCGNSSGWNGTGVSSNPYVLSFDGSDDLVDAGTDVIGTNSVTMTAWIKLNGFGEDNLGYIFNNGTLRLYINNVNGNKPCLKLTSNETMWVESAVSSIALGQWYHIAVTRSADRKTSFYINGNLSGTADQDAGPPAAASSNLILGNKADATRTFDGDIAKASVHMGILTAAEISAECKADESRFSGVTCN